MTEEIKTTIENNQETRDTVITEVTSIAKEEEKTGQKINVPNDAELVRRASISLFRSKRILVELAGKMSKKALLRSISAGFDLAQEGIPVYLKTPEEKQFFAHAQRVFSDKFIILQNQINEELKKRKEEQNKQVQNTEQQPETKEGEQNG